MSALRRIGLRFVVVAPLLLPFAARGGVVTVTETKRVTPAKDLSRYRSVVDSAPTGPVANEVGPGETTENIIPQEPPAWINDPATKTQFLEALRNYYAYRIHGYEHRKKVFEWQHTSSIIIFVAVLLLVLLGMYFAAVQFHRDIGRVPSSQEADRPALGGEIGLGPEGLKVSSPVLGVIILALSLGFFYLYLAFVYPIVNTF